MREPGRELERARESLVFARHVLSGGFSPEAGRAAYMATFHAAQALIIVRTGKTPKTHSGTRTEFNRVALSEPLIAREYTALLTQTYEMKNNSDYGEPTLVTKALAETAIADAARFVDDIAALLGPL